MIASWGTAMVGQVWAAVASQRQVGKNYAWARGRRALLVVAILLWPTVAAAENTVDRSRDLIADLADQTFALLSRPSLSDAERTAGVETLLVDAFAIDGIARFALGPFWRSTSDADREEYLALFQNMVVDYSASRIAAYSGQPFEVTSAETASGRRAVQQLVLVKSRVYNPEPVRVDWWVAHKDDIYKVVDVVIGGLSLAQTYRDQFTAVVRRSGMDGLLMELRDRYGS